MADRMERDGGVVRWSPNSSCNEFMIFNYNQRIIQLYEAKGQARPGSFDYERLSKHDSFPSQFNTYDWSPIDRGLVAFGTSGGDIRLLRVDDDSNASTTLPLRAKRSCQSVAFNTSGLLAVGLDRVRNDHCLQIWDVTRLPPWDVTQSNSDISKVTMDPVNRLEASVSITSVRFFEDSPQTLVVGVKNQSVRIHDLRDPNSAVINFQTRCNNNIAIDFADCNYFASSSLDHPGIVIWDRRVSGNSTASSMYLESYEDGLPWGAVLKLKSAIDIEKNVHIKQMRYCREHRGTLGILSTAGQLQVLDTREEYIEPGSEDYVPGSPKLLEVHKTFGLEYAYNDSEHKRKSEDRIVSFDWVNASSSDLDPRVIVLRATGNFEILKMPGATTDHLSQLLPWNTHRDDLPPTKLPSFKDPLEQEAIVGPLFTNLAKMGYPVFGPTNVSSAEATQKIIATVKKAIHSDENLVVDLLAATSTDYFPSPNRPNNIESLDAEHLNLDIVATNFVPSKSAKLNGAINNPTNRSNPSTTNISKAESIDSVMLRRALGGYLFNCQRNITLIASDEKVLEAWEWIAVAEDAAKDDGMISDNIDLSYMGVYTVWMNSLGEKSKSRLIDGSIIPDGSQWERLIAHINKRAGRSDFRSVATDKPHHRSLCLSICRMNSAPAEMDQGLKALVEKEKYTTAAAWALFEGNSSRAVEILRQGGKHLLFVAMALDIKLKSDTVLDLGGTGWREALEGHPQMADDPYLRAIYGYITTGEWLAVADEPSLPLRIRVGVALRKFDDAELTSWLTKEMDEAIRTGDIEGIVLSGITDNMVDILAKYIERFMDYQTPILMMSFCYPRYIDDVRCGAWRKAYQDLLQRNKKFILRVKFEQQSTIKSRLRDGTPLIRAPPRQVTVRCLRCDGQSANDMHNSGAALTSAPGPSTTTRDERNPLIASGINSGLCCPRCGSHLSRCAVCMEIVGVPRSDRPELSNDLAIKSMANFPTFCLKCRHVMHMDHSAAWFSRHMECPVPECHCQCNESATRPS